MTFDQGDQIWQNFDTLRKIKSLWPYLGALLVLNKLLNILWQILMILRLIVIVVNGQILHK